MPNITANTFKEGVDKHAYLLKLAPHFSVFDIAEKYMTLHPVDQSCPFIYKAVSSTVSKTIDSKCTRAMFRISPALNIASVEVIVNGESSVYEAYPMENGDLVIIVIAAEGKTASLKLNNKSDNMTTTIVGVGF